MPLLCSENLLQEEIFTNHMILLLEEIFTNFNYCVHNRRYVRRRFMDPQMCANLNYCYCVQDHKIHKLKDSS